MRATDTAVPSNVVEVLRKATVLEDRLVLNGQLDAKLYKSTAAVLDRVGGKWNKKEKAHLFTTEDDVRAIVAEILATGSVPAAPPKNPLAFFETQPFEAGAVIGLCLRYAGGSDAWRRWKWLEPNAGEGALLDHLVYCGVEKSNITAFELDAGRCEILRAKGYTANQGDFLTLPYVARYDCIVMNPPFAVAEDKQAYIAHFLRAYKTHLKVGGILSGIAPSSLQYRTDKRTTELRELVASCGEIRPFPKGAFKDAGTMVDTVHVSMVKPR